MLIDSISSYEHLEKLRTIYAIEAVMGASEAVHSSTPKKSTQSVRAPIHNTRVDFTFDEIKDSLNGIGRIVRYEVKNPDLFVFQPNDMSNLDLKEIAEGNFVNGVQHGYCRTFRTGTCSRLTLLANNHKSKSM